MGFGLELLQVLEERPCGRVRVRRFALVSQEKARAASWCWGVWVGVFGARDTEARAPAWRAVGSP